MRLPQSYNPGNLKSELQRNAGFVVRLFDVIVYPAIFGAYTELFAGLSEDLSLDKDQGCYIVPWGRKWSVRKDVEAERGEGKKAAQLYDWCDKETIKYA